jgi:hypothetical protein
MTPNKPSHKIPSPWLSLLPISILVALLALTIYIFGSDALGEVVKFPSSLLMV